MINKNPDDGITRAELSQFIESKKKDKNIPFGDEYIEKIFAIMDINKDNEITMYD